MAPVSRNVAKVVQAIGRLGDDGPFSLALYPSKVRLHSPAITYPSNRRPDGAGRRSVGGFALISDVSVFHSEGWADAAYWLIVQNE